MGQRPPQLTGDGERTGGAGKNVAVEVPVTARSERDRCCIDRDIAHHHGISSIGDDGAASGEREEMRLGCLIAFEAAVHVEMIGAKFSQVATVGRNRLACKSKRRRLDNEDVSVGIVDRRDKRDVGVPGGDGDTTIGCERGDGELDRGRLAVGAGDGDDRPIVPDRCEIKLGHDRHTGGVGDGERLVLLRETGVGTTNAAAATRSGVRRSTRA